MAAARRFHVDDGDRRKVCANLSVSIAKATLNKPRISKILITKYA